jgi:predicted AlkP superfamily phosphohydrolase/phosphomutase
MVTGNEMTKTEYLFGYPKEHYHGVEFPQLGYDRVKDANELIRKLQPRVLYYPANQNKFQKWLDKRIKKAQEAIKTWEKILEVEEN